MKRVYLDQNKWIDLAGARRGLAKGERYQDVLAVAEAGVDHGLVSFPLSSFHYIETANRREWRSRRDLATVMADLSRFHTIAPQQALFPPEIDHALRAFFGRPLSCRSPKPFGVGAAHAFDSDIPPFRVPESIPVEAGIRWALERGLSTVREWWLLVGVPPETEKALEGYDPKAHLEVAERFASEQEALRNRRKPEGWHRGESGNRIAKAEAIIENEEAFNDALRRAGLDWRPIYALERAGMSKLVEAVPTLHASAELRRLRHASSQKEWEPSDLADIAALSVAIVYCDVVVTERQWAAMIRQGKLDTANNTSVLADLTDLPQHLL